MKVLIVVDVQNDFVTGALGTPEAQAIIPNIKNKISEYRSRGYYIIFTQDTHYPDYLSTNEGRHLPVPHCIINTKGHDIVDGLLNDEDVNNHNIISKETFGYSHWKYLEKINPNTIEIIGLCTDICVISNALILKARFPDINIMVDASCCAGVTPKTHKAAIEVMKMCQIEIINE